MIDNLKFYYINKTVAMQKARYEYNGWVDLGISIRYDLNTSEITKTRGLIKRRQTIIK